MEILVEYLDEVVYSFQIAQIIVVHIDTYAKVETRIATIHNFEVTKL